VILKKIKNGGVVRCLFGTLEEPIGVFNGACYSKAVKSKVDSESAKPKSVIEGDF